MKIAILGTRGIPNHYGGFEQFAEYLSRYLVETGYDVTVYNSHNHPYQEKEWNGVKIKHKYDPEDKLGTAGQFIYDLNCIMDCRKSDYDIILQLGYTSSSVWGWLLPRHKSIVTTNMDGLEWKRTKYSQKVRNFLQFAEKLGVKYSDYLIADSIGIQEYLLDKYHKESVFIPYGAHLFEHNNPATLTQYGVGAYAYDMLIARLEPENSIEVILDGVVQAGTKRPFLVVGKHQTAFGNYLKDKFAAYPAIKFIGGIYNIDILNDLRYYSNIYFHGHTVGGTNPSLLEAMASDSLICAHDNPFNKYILEQDALYFTTAGEVANHLQSVDCQSVESRNKIANNRNKITNKYAWPIVNKQYADHFEEIMAHKLGKAKNLVS